MFNEELFWYEFGELIHHIILATVIILQAGFVIWFMIRWIVHNVDFKWSPSLNIKGTPVNIEGKTTTTTKKGSLGPVEVDVKKHINIDKAEISNIKSDEKIKGKVKTQKNKLRSLRK